MLFSVVSGHGGDSNNTTMNMCALKQMRKMINELSPYFLIHININNSVTNFIPFPYVQILWVHVSARIAPSRQF